MEVQVIIFLPLQNERILQTKPIFYKGKMQKKIIMLKNVFFIKMFIININDIQK